MAVWVGTKDEKVRLEQREAGSVREGGWFSYKTGSQFLFLLLLPQSWLLTVIVAQPALYFHLILYITCHTCTEDSTHILYQFPKAKVLGLSYKIYVYCKCCLYSTHTFNELIMIIFTAVWFKCFDMKNFNIDMYCKSGM